jgi:acyl carrier protein
MTGNWDDRFEVLLRKAVPLLTDGPIDPALNLRDAGLDSMASVEFLLNIEAAYGIVIPDESLTQESFASPSTLWRVVLSARGVGEEE